jgi:hypothetical protein
MRRGGSILVSLVSQTQHSQHLQTNTDKQSQEGTYTYTLETTNNIFKQQHNVAVFQATLLRSRRPGWIEWCSSTARAILLSDLEPGDILHRQDRILEAEVWEFYKTLPQFNNVVDSQFVVRLKDHRTKASEYLHQALQEDQYFARDRLSYERQSHNERGEPVFDLSPARALLREDVSNGVHTTMSVARLQNSRVQTIHSNPRSSKTASYKQLVGPSKTSESSRIAFAMTARECLTRNNNKPIPDRCMLWS